MPADVVTRVAQLAKNNPSDLLFTDRLNRPHEDIDGAQAEPIAGVEDVALVDPPTDVPDLHPPIDGDESETEDEGEADEEEEAEAPGVGAEEEAHAEAIRVDAPGVVPAVDDITAGQQQNWTLLSQKEKAVNQRRLCLRHKWLSQRRTRRRGKQISLLTQSKMTWPKWATKEWFTKTPSLTAGVIATLWTCPVYLQESAGILTAGSQWNQLAGQEPKAGGMPL